MTDSSDRPDLPPSWLPRRELLRRAGGGFGMLGLAGLLQADDVAADLADAPLAPRPSHMPARAKHVIWLFINGGPSHVDTFDYKPALAAHAGEPLPGFDKNTGFFAGAVGGLMPSPFEFRRHGSSGAWVSSLFPRLARHVDKMAFIKSCWTDSNNHAPALLKINTGIARMGYPCTGSWVTYGLGSENSDLPGFVVMYDTKGRGLPKGYATNWSAGFLPGVFQGTGIDTAGTPIPNLARDAALTDAQQRAQFSLAARLNGLHRATTGDDAALQARIESFELAYRMQSSAPEATDISNESQKPNPFTGWTTRRPLYSAGNVFSLEDWSNAVCASSSFIQAARTMTTTGTPTATSKKTTTCMRGKPTSPSRDFSPTSNNADFSIPPSSSGAGNSADNPPLNTPRAVAVITTPMVSPCGWRAAASKVEPPWAPPMSLAARRSKNPSMSRTCMPPCLIAWGSTPKGSPISMAGLTRNLSVSRVLNPSRKSWLNNF